MEDLSGVPPKRLLFRFTVVGEPQTRGSKKAVRIKNKAGAVVAAAAVDTNDKKSKPWMEKVSRAALDEMKNRGLELERDRPIEIHATFVVPRSKSDFLKSGKVRPGARVLPKGRKDIDKLHRPLQDALSKVVFYDDNQVSDVRACKRYGDAAGVIVAVYVYPETLNELKQWKDEASG